MNSAALPRVTAVVATLLLTALAATAAVADSARLGLPVMGTVLQIEVVASDRSTAATLCRRALETARTYDDLLTTWRTEGELARLNQQAGQGQIKISRPLHTALSRMLELSAATAGAFDPSVGRAVEFWRDSASDGPAPNASPGRGLAERLALGTRAEASEGLQYWAALAGGVRRDAGGIGKGMARDAIVAMLRNGGATAAFLDFGGSSQLGFGVPDKGGEWTVALPSLAGVAGTVTLGDRAISTSLASTAGSAAGPIIDPASMRPIAMPRLATVIGSDATSAEAWSTALVVLGHQGLARAARAGVDAVFEDGSGRTRSGRTAGLEQGGLDGAEQNH